MEKGWEPMNRTIEKVLAMIASILNVFGIAGTGVFLFSLDSFFKTDSLQQQIIEDVQQSTGTKLTLTDLQDLSQVFGSIGWFVIIVLIISLIIGTAGMIKLHSDTKLAGILFIGAGIFACLISVPSILFYIAAILCFTRKKAQPQESPVGKKAPQQISNNQEHIK